MAAQLDRPLTAIRLQVIATRRHRHPVLHWGALAISATSLAIFAAWVFRDTHAVPSTWVTVDVALCGVLAGEFFTRSGLHWNWTTYLRTHLFDFIAIIPGLVLVQHGVPGKDAWAWILLIARGTRVIDRTLGDGFVERKILALMESFEEEIADRVTLRMLASLQDSLDRGSLGQAVAKALTRNKAAVLARVRAEHPQEGLSASLARVSGLEALAVRAEEGVYDAIVQVMESKEIDRAIRDTITAAIEDVRKGVGGRSWRQRLFDSDTAMLDANPGKATAGH